MIKVRQLDQSDTGLYKSIRLKMLEENPESFGGSVEESKTLLMEFFENYILNNFIVGAFDKENLIGSMGIYLNGNNKTKHSASMFGVYIEKKIPWSKYI